jgi:transposase
VYNTTEKANVILREVIMPEETKKCPHCAEEIKADATECEHCGGTLAAAMNVAR